jgi:hypothetical protein
VFINKEEAKHEINRLNHLVAKRESLQKGKNLISSTYSYQIGRIKKGILKIDKDSNTNSSDKFE